MTFKPKMKMTKKLAAEMAYKKPQGKGWVVVVSEINKFGAIGHPWESQEMPHRIACEHVRRYREQILRDAGVKI